MPLKVLVIFLTLTLLVGCSPQKQLPAGNPAPEKTASEKRPESPPRYAPVYENKVPKATVPEDARHPEQRIIAVFRDGHNICVIAGREYLMEGKATIQKHDNLLPFKYIAIALGVPDDYTFARGNSSIVLHYNGKDYRFGGQLEEGVLYTSTPRNLADMGLDVLLDHHAGRFEILEPLPLTVDDQKIGDLYLNMTIDKVIAVFGRPNNQDKNYSNIHYADYTFISAFSDEQPHTIMVRSDKIATPRGIRVGDSLSRVFELYGRGYSRGFGYAQPDIFEYRFPKSVRREGYLSFEVDENNRVKEIVINGIALPHYQVTR